MQSRIMRFVMINSGFQSTDSQFCYCAGSAFRKYQLVKELHNSTAIWDTPIRRSHEENNKTSAGHHFIFVLVLLTRKHTALDFLYKIEMIWCKLIMPCKPSSFKVEMFDNSADWI